MKPDAEWLLVEIRKLRAQLGAVASTGGLRTPAHAATHADAGSDPVNVTTLDGYPGDASLFLDGTGNFTTPGGGGSPGPPAMFKTVGCVIGDGTNEITAGEKGIARADNDGTIVAAIIYATDAAVTPGDILVDVWSELPSNHFPPISTDNIMGSSLLELNGSDYSEDTTLSGVTLGVTAGQMFRFVVPAGSPAPSGVLQVVALLVYEVA